MFATTGFLKEGDVRPDIRPVLLGRAEVSLGPAGVSLSPGELAMIIKH